MYQNDPTTAWWDKSGGGVIPPFEPLTFLWISLIALLLAASAFLSLSETALVGLSKIRLRHLVERGVKQAKQVEALIVGRFDQVISSLLVANNFVNTAISCVGTALCVAWLGPEWGIVAATVLMGTLILIFGEITPKVFSIRYAEQVALTVVTVLRVVVRVFEPISRPFALFSRMLLRSLGVEMTRRSPLVTEEELKLMIELGKEEGVLGEHERTLLHRIFEFGDLKVKDVMVPRERMVAVPAGATHDDVLTVLTEEGHSRIPVYQDSPDRIIGVLYAQELLHIWREGWLIVLQDLIHPPFEVSPERRVSDLLLEFQRQRVQIAIVVDADKRALGMVTLEDLVEEIVGEIHEDQPGWTA